MSRSLKRGLGNGISIIIFSRIAWPAQPSLGGLFELVSHPPGAMYPFTCTGGFASSWWLWLGVVVLLNVVQLRFLSIMQSSRLVNKIYGGQEFSSSVEANMARRYSPDLRVVSIILFPATIAWLVWVVRVDAGWLDGSCSTLAPVSRFT